MTRPPDRPRPGYALAETSTTASPNIEEDTVTDIEQAKRDYEEIGTVHAGKRCALDWTPWMGDWFVSSSPRNGNSHAEGYWDHWVDLAIGILKDPLTAIVRPDAHAAAADLKTNNFYDGANRKLTDEELAARFSGEED